MAELVRQVLLASADATGEVVECSRMDNLFLGLIVSSTSADLVADVLIEGSIDGSNWSAAATGSAVSALPSGITYTAGTGTLAISSPTAVAHPLILKVAEPPRFVRVSYDYTGGGGTSSVRATAFGWLHRT